MIAFKNEKSVPINFTGVCKILNKNCICYYLNGKIHREDGHAVEFIYAAHMFYNSNLVECIKVWYYKNTVYGLDNDFNINSWKEKVEELKREDELRIFL